MRDYFKTHLKRYALTVKQWLLFSLTLLPFIGNSQCPTITSQGIFNPNDDVLISSYHQSMAKTTSGYVTWGEDMAANGTTDPNVTQVIPANGYNYTGTVIHFAVSGNSGGQGFVATTDNLYAWGTVGESVNGNFVSGTSFAAMPGIPFSAADILNLHASSDVLFVLLNSGEIWVATTGTTSPNGNSSNDGTIWQQVQTSSGVPLTGAIQMTGNKYAGYALINNGDIYTWGNNVVLADGSGIQNLDFATLMTAPPVAVSYISSFTNDSGNTGVLALGTDTKIYGVGANTAGELITTGTGVVTTWTTIQASGGGDFTGALYLATSHTSEQYAGAAVITQGATTTDPNILYTWGVNNTNSLGQGGDATIQNPTIPASFTLGTDDPVAASVGGHATTFFNRANGGSICFVGHISNNSTGGLTTGDGSSFECIVPTGVELCGSILLISANDDSGSVVQGVGGTVITNVLSNDDRDGSVPNNTTVDLTQVNTSNPGVTLNTSNGAVNVTPLTPSGIYTLEYQICDAGSATNCKTAIATVTVLAPCSISAISSSNESTCNDNSTANNINDDTFTADITVTFTNKPTTGTLNLSGDATASISVTGLTSPHTFTGVTLPANGSAISLTATFSADVSCTLTDNAVVNAPFECSDENCPDVIPPGSPSAPIASGDISFDITNPGTNASAKTFNSITVGGETFTNLLVPDNISYSYTSESAGNQQIIENSVNGANITDPSSTFDPALISANTDRNLNHYFRNDNNIFATDYVNFEFNYDINAASNRYVVITERGGNNTMEIQAIDNNGDVIGTPQPITRVGQPGQTYIDTGIPNENGQTIHATVYPLTALVGSNVPINGVRLTQSGASGGDGGDGKVFIVYNPFFLTPPPTISLTTSVTQPTCPSNTGSINIIATSNGGGTLEYSINGASGPWQSSNTFTPGPGSYTAAVRYVGAPLCANIDSNSVTLTDAACNPGPVAGDENEATIQDVDIIIDLTNDDTDADGIDDSSIDLDPATPGQQSTISITNEGVYTDNSDGTITFNPDAAFTGTSTITYTVDDTLGATSNIANITVDVQAPPVANNDTTSTLTDTNVSIDLTDDDTDSDGTIDDTTIDLDPATPGQQSTISITNEGVYTDNGDGTITFDPEPTFNGVSTITYTVNDDEGNTSNIANITVDVQAPPVANNDTTSTLTDTNVSIDLTDDDTDSDGTIDDTTIDLDPATSGQQSTISITNEGIYTDNGDGTITFDPEPTFNGVSTITYTVNDNEGNTSNIANITVDVQATPVANNDAESTLTDTNVSIDLTDDDTDSDGTIDDTTIDLDPATSGQQSTISVTNEGVYTDNGDGTITFDPEPTFNGVSTITYTVNDDEGNTSNIANITVDVQAPPVANNDAESTLTDTNVSIDLTDDDTDSDGTIDDTTIDLDPATSGQQSTISITNEGVYTDNGDGTITFDPEPTFNGVSTITYTVNDDEGNTSNIANITVDVQAPPVANNDAESTLTDTNVSIDLTDDDTDSDGTIDVTTIDLDPATSGQQSTISITNEGIYTDNGDGTITFDPEPTFNGVSTITYTVNDNEGNTSNNANITVDVLPDHDRDGINDFIDLDDDNDGISDLDESNGIDPSADDDNDGVPNYLDDEPSNPLVGDTNGSVEPAYDFDGDGIPNHFDIDADNDGILDVNEASNGDLDTNNDGVIDSNDDGFSDTTDNGQADSTEGTTPTDTDGNPTDGPNFLDIDADDDGIPDNVEAQLTSAYIVPADTFDNVGLDTNYLGGLTPIDTDNDNIPDYVDLDSDGDGIDDVIEAGQGTFVGADADNDGLDDGFDDTPGNDVNNDLNTGAITTDNDDLPTTTEVDFREVADSDGDGVLDTKETEDGTDPNNPCDYIIASATVTVSGDYLIADCDGDGVINDQEIIDGTNPEDPCDYQTSSITLSQTGDYLISDCDGDGVTNGDELSDNTDPRDPCDFDVLNVTLDKTGDYLDADCDGDLVTNGQELNDGTNPEDPCSHIGGTIPSGVACDIIFENDLVQPNLNDGVFRITNIESFPENTVRIYNRWGVLVFETRGYDNGNNGFRGISNGRATITKEEALPVGVYFYVVDYTVNGEGRSKQGYLYVNR